MNMSHAVFTKPRRQFNMAKASNEFNQYKIQEAEQNEEINSEINSGIQDPADLAGSKTVTDLGPYAAGSAAGSKLH